MTEKKKIPRDRELDIRIAFEKGKKSKNPIIYRVTRVAEYLWDTTVILGEALADVPKRRKIK